MKLESTRLLQDPDKSFIVHLENKSFARWHHHPEVELVLILNGRCKRLIGMRGRETALFEYASGKAINYHLMIIYFAFMHIYIIKRYIRIKKNLNLL